MKRHAAPIVAFSGMDGAGKSTQIEQLQACLDRRRIPNVCCWSRGGYTPLFNLAKQTLRRMPGNTLPPAGHSERRHRALRKPWVRRLWLTLSLLDLGFLYGVKIRWWRLFGKLVICDRYLPDTRIDFQLNFPEECVDSWWLWRLMERSSPRPDLGFLMLIPVEESLRRSLLKDEPFPEMSERLAARRECYRRVERAQSWTVLDGLRPPDDLFAEIRRSLEPLLPDGNDAD